MQLIKSYCCYLSAVSTKASSVSCPSESRRLFVSSSQTSPLDSLQSWSSSALMVAQQYVGEHLGRRSRTAPDPDTSARVAALREQRRQFVHVLQLATSLASQLDHVMRTQRCLAEALSELSQSGGDLPLGEQCSSSSDTLKLVSKNGDTLLSMLLCVFSNYAAAYHSVLLMLIFVVTVFLQCFDIAYTTTSKFLLVG